MFLELACHPEVPKVSLEARWEPQKDLSVIQCEDNLLQSGGEKETEKQRQRCRERQKQRVRMTERQEIGLGRSDRTHVLQDLSCWIY